MPAQPEPAPKWTRAQLQAERDKAEAAFREERIEEGPRVFAALCETKAQEVAAALEVTGDLRELTGQVLRDDPDLWQVLRYFCAPPISEEDLWTLIGGSKFKHVPVPLADKVASVITNALDPFRFPWAAQHTVLRLQ